MSNCLQRGFNDPYDPSASSAAPSSGSERRSRARLPVPHRRVESLLAPPRRDVATAPLRSPRPTSRPFSRSTASSRARPHRGSQADSQAAGSGDRQASTPPVHSQPARRTECTLDGTRPRAPEDSPRHHALFVLGRTVSSPLRRCSVPERTKRTKRLSGRDGPKKQRTIAAGPGPPTGRSTRRAMPRWVPGAEHPPTPEHSRAEI